LILDTSRCSDIHKYKGERAKVQNKSQWDKKFTENYNSIEMR